MLLYQQLLNGINEFLQDKVMSQIWPNSRELDRQTVRDNIKNISFEALGDVQRVSSFIDSCCYKDSDNSSFINNYPHIANALQDDKDTGYAIAERLYNISLKSDDPFVYVNDIIHIIENEYAEEN